MSPERAASISSAETERSRPWADVVGLGERIVTQLGLDDSDDTLGRWMAHRVAELIEQAERNDDEAKKQASELILRLWARRSDWPHGWPPAETEKIRERLETPSYPERPERREGDGPWLARLTALDRLHYAEYEVWLRLALADADTDEEIAAAEEQADDLEENELALLRALAIRRRMALEHFAKHLDGDDSPLTRGQFARKELEDLEKRRHELLEEAIAEHDAASADVNEQ